MKRKKSFRCLALLLVISLFVTGCAKKDTTGKEGKSTTAGAMGRYVEEEIKVSEEELSGIYGIIQKPEGGLELYGLAEEKQVLYTSEDGKNWEKQEFPEWLKDTEKVNLGMVKLGEDGCYYALKAEYGKKDGVGYSKQQIWKSEDGKIGADMALPLFDEVAYESDDFCLYMSFSNIGALENGNLVVMDSHGEQVEVISPEGKTVYEIDIVNPSLGTQYEDSFAVQGNTIAGIKKGGQMLTVYDGSTRQEIRSIEYPFGNNDGTKIALLEDNTAFIADRKGIHRLEPGGTLWQTVVDGELNSLSMPSTWITSFFVLEGEQESYLLQCGTKLLYYSYDASVAAIPEKEITVYSLRENATVRQAIALFQQKHQDVRVRYTVGMEEGNEDKKEDYIRAFNTELLDGNGADVILLDELPYSDYKEKGILENLSGIIDFSELLPQISSQAEDGREVYAVPLRVLTPLIYGNAEVVENGKDAEKIFSYVKEKCDKNYIRMAAKYSVLDFFLTICKNQFLEEDGTVKETEARAFLENLETFMEKSGVNDSEPENFKGQRMNDVLRPLPFSNPAPMINGRASAYWSTESSFATIYEIKSLGDMVPDISWGILGDTLLSNGSIGLNKQAADKEQALEFVRFLFSEEVQGEDVYDGFPVNIRSLDKLAAKEPQEDYSIGGSMMDEDGTFVSIDGEDPSVEIKQQFAEAMLSAEHISGQIDSLYDLIFDELAPLVDGEKSVEDTLQALIGKVNTYVAE